MDKIDFSTYADKTLDLEARGYTSVPADVFKLTQLEDINLRGLSGVPDMFDRLPNLRFLDLTKTGLTEAPASVFRLKNLVTLDLSGNNIARLPEKIDALPPLVALDLSNNKLETLPSWLGLLPETARIDISDNPLTGMPEVASQGSAAVLAFLRAGARRGERQWVSKLLVVGEGEVGKTSLLRSLRKEKFIANLDSTHGIAQDTLAVPHPNNNDVTMTLNTWDFGGQDIYHATHQFFLTNRSLFLLVWSARKNPAQNKLDYWLDTIKALAPDSPILLVGTNAEQYSTPLPLDEIGRKYPRVVGNWPVSNRTGEGIGELKAAIAEAAAGLPLMGELWPSAWLDAAKSIRSMPERNVRPKDLCGHAVELGVEEKEFPVLARWLHELGDILYFQDNEDLAEVVLLHPTWVTEHISRVLVSKEVEQRKGVFSRKHMLELWSDIPDLHDLFLRLMQQFDLSYRTLEDRDISLVVERLPVEAPDYRALWDAQGEAPDCAELAIRYQLNTIPAGIPTWFIAREHRFTINTHWRKGALFAEKLFTEKLHDDAAREALGKPESEDYGTAAQALGSTHLALVEADTKDNWVKLTVRGPMPANFFALMKDGLEYVLDRFKGLNPRRWVLCPGHDGEPCDFEFDLVNLENALKKKRDMVECGRTSEMVPLATLLYGVHGQSTLDQSTLNKILAGVTHIEGQVAGVDGKIGHVIALLELQQREFLNQFRAMQQIVDERCPNVFVLFKEERQGAFDKALGGLRGEDSEQIVLHLCCQQPGAWHLTDDRGRYEIPQPAQWVKSMAPYLNPLITVLKVAAPFVGPIAGIVNAETAELLKDRIELMKALVERLDTIEDAPNLALAEGLDESRKGVVAHGAQLRMLRKLLESQDTKDSWGGLERVVTKEGHILWLCEKHKAQYAEP